MAKTDRSLACNGREFDRDGQPVEGSAGQPHGLQFSPRSRYERQARYDLRARMAGWRLGPIRPDGTRDVMCPACGKPDPIVDKELRRIAKR
jgi:hypothetical protein